MPCGERGADVVYVTCGGALSSICATMAAFGVGADSSDAAKARICRRCKLTRNLVRRDFGFESYDFESVLTDADEQQIQALLREARPDDVDAFVVEGTRVGSATLYEYLIQQKRFHRVFDPAEWAAFLPRLANTLRSLFAARRIIDPRAADAHRRVQHAVLGQCDVAGGRRGARHPGVRAARRAEPRSPAPDADDRTRLDHTRGVSADP